jgi:hypothetical protein
LITELVGIIRKCSLCGNEQDEGLFVDKERWLCCRDCLRSYYKQRAIALAERTDKAILYAKGNLKNSGKNYTREDQSIYLAKESLGRQEDYRATGVKR